MKFVSDTYQWSSIFENSTVSISNDSMQPVLPHLPYLIAMLQVMIYAIELILGVTLNSALILLILFRKSLHQRGFTASLLILATNIGFALPLLSASIHTAPLGEWTLGVSYCLFVAFSNQMFQSQRWLLTAVLIVDRALTINRPLKYEKHGRRVVAILSTAALIVGFLIAIVVPTMLHSCIGFLPGLNSCYIISGTDKMCDLYLANTNTLLLLLGGVLPFILYIWMVCKARKAQTLVVPEPTTHLRTNAVTSPFSLTQKQVLTIFLFFWTLLGCSLPYYLSYFVTYLSLENNNHRGLIVGYFSLLFTQPIFYGLTIADPIALMWHKDVKRELKIIRYSIETYIQMKLVNIRQLPPPSMAAAYD